MLTDSQEQQLYEAIFAGRKIEAIKLHRDFTNAGLKESKEFVDALESDLRAESPERFTLPPSRGGCAGMFVIAMVGGLVAAIVV